MVTPVNLFIKITRPVTNQLMLKIIFQRFVQGLIKKLLK